MKKEFTFAFRQSVPVLIGYIFLGIAFGILLQSAGYNFIWAIVISIFVYAGSMQFALVGMLSGGVSFLTTAIMTLSINSRHIFYGLSFIEKFKAMGIRGIYMIFSLTDETYSLLCSDTVPSEMDEKKVFFFIAMLNHLYWICGSGLGALIGQLIPFNSAGVEFAMTALFVVIFVEQLLESKNRIPAVIGAVSGVLCLLIFGAEKFVLPSLILAVAALLFYRRLTPAKKEAIK